MKQIELIVFDMAGTTVKDNNEVENCFWEAATKSGIETTREKIISMMGWSKKLVFETLWKEQKYKSKNEEIENLVNQSYSLFKRILEHHYQTANVAPTEGCTELFKFLKEKNIKIALTTGFYREVTDIILRRLGWDIGLNNQYQGTDIINASISSDQVIAGRPSPYMVFRAMELCQVIDVRKVIKIGDTPSDLAEGKNAGCESLGIVNGTHTRNQLEKYENDGLMENLLAFQNYLIHSN